MRQIRGLVTPRGRFRLEVARQQIRRIGLQQQTFRRDRRQQLAQLQSPPLIAYPTGNTDKQAQIRAFLHLAAAAGKAVQHRARDLLKPGFKQRQKPIVGVAAVQNTGIDSSAASANWALNATSPARAAWKNSG